MALDSHCSSIAFPLLATGSYGFPKELGALVDEVRTYIDDDYRKRG